MAIDYWCWQRHLMGDGPPVLRFYQWTPAALSLGYHQKEIPSQWRSLLACEGVDLVRRPTGGRAVLHGGDLTYGLIYTCPLPQRRDSYCHICGWLRRVWGDRGVPLYFGQGDRSYAQQDSCFASATKADLVTETGIKVIGSAQLRRGSVVLQHGSILDGHRSPGALYESLFGERFPAVPPLGDRYALMQQLSAQAEAYFGMELVPQPLQEQEWIAIGDLLSRFAIGAPVPPGGPHTTGD